MPNQGRYILFLTLLFVALSSLLVPDAAAQSTGVVTGRMVDAGDGTPHDAFDLVKQAGEANGMIEHGVVMRPAR